MSQNDEIAARLAKLPEPDLDDPDNPEWTEEDFARARPIEEVLPPELLAAFPNIARRVGRPPSEAPKVPVKLRLDPDVVAAYKADGPGWQTRMNADLKDAAQRRRA